MRTASEVLRSLESRIARLERTPLRSRTASGLVRRTASGIVPRVARVVFRLVQTDDPADLFKGLREISGMLRTKVENEGYNRRGELICFINVDDLNEVHTLYQILKRNGGSIFLDTGFRAEGFTLYPQGVNGPAYHDIEEYLDEQGVL